MNQSKINRAAFPHPLLHEQRNKLTHLARHIVFNYESIRLEEIKGLHDDALPKIEYGFQIETREISGIHPAVLTVNIQFYGGELDYLNAFFEEDLLDRSAGDNQKIYIRPPLLDAGNHRKSAKSMAQSYGIMCIHKNALYILTIHQIDTFDFHANALNYHTRRQFQQNSLLAIVTAEVNGGTGVPPVYLE